MEVQNSQSALLSNYEVFTLLKELENDHLQRSKAAMRIKKEEEAAGAPTPNINTLPDISENLRTIQVEAIQYLSSDFLPTTQQTPEGVTKLIQGLAPYDLTKAEKLQIANLAPTLPVELYVVVEELEDRLGDKMETILELVQSSLQGPTVANGRTTAPSTTVFSHTTNSLYQDPLFTTTAAADAILSSWDDDADIIVGQDVEFVDHGEGGLEGDLDVEEE